MSDQRFTCTAGTRRQERRVEIVRSSPQTKSPNRPIPNLTLEDCEYVWSSPDLTPLSPREEHGSFAIDVVGQLTLASY